MSTDDLPMISLPTDSTQVELTPQKEVSVNAPEPRRNPTTQVPKPAAAPAPAASDPRKASEARRPGTVVPLKPAADANSASRPAAPVVKAAPPPPAASHEDEDPEKLLREYADRQKTKLVRLEQQVVEYKKVVAERDSLRAKVEALSKELQEARKQAENASKSDEVIKDLQGKVDAAILSNSILSDDKEKLKKGLSQQTEHLKKSEDRAVTAEKSLAEVQTALEDESQAREDADARVAAAIEALQGEAPAPKAAAPKPAAEKPVSEAVTRPIAQTAPARPAAAEEKPAAARGPAPRPPGRFSFLKK